MRRPFSAIAASLAALAISTNASAYDDSTPANISDQPAPSAKEETTGPFGPMRLGALAGAGASTHPVDLEAFVKVLKIAGVGFEYAFAPQIHLAGVDVRTRAIGADARLFALSSSFFLGAGAGYQSATASAGQMGTATVTSYYVTPRLGWLWIADFGLALGVDLGATIPVRPRLAVSSDVPRSYLQPQIDRANTFAHMTMPDLKLRVGVMF